MKTSLTPLTSGLPLITFVILIGAALITLSLFLPNSFVQSTFILNAIGVIGDLIPCVSVFERASIDPARTGLIWSIGWMMAPIYLVIYIFCYPPLGAKTRTWIRKNQTSMGGKPWKGVYVAIVVLSCIVLSDFNVIHLGSLYRGTVFYKGAQGAGLLGIPFQSQFGSAIYAWVIPLCEAFVYYALLCSVINVKIYNSPN